MNMKTSSDGLNLIKRFEGYSAIPYKDIKGRMTIGYGHLIKTGEVFGAVSNIEATNLLAGDVEWAEEVVNSSVTVTINQEQFDALVDFVYNLGSGNFDGSTMLRDIDGSESMDKITAQMILWDRAAGQVSQGLLNRREAEAKLYSTGDYGYPQKST